MNYVLKPFSLEKLTEIFDKHAIHVITYMIKKSIFSQPEIKETQKALPIQIPKEHIEQWLSQALEAESIGAGSYPVDLIAKNQKWGADVKMLSAKVDELGLLKNGDSGETSLGQNFKTAGKDLDSLFIEQKFDQIKDLWIDLLNEKLATPIKDYGINNIYYFILIRGGDKLYLAGLEVILCNLRYVTVNNDRTSKSSVYLNDFIDNSLGNVKIYKAKKRMELRLHPKKWFENNMLIEFPISLDENICDLRKYTVSGGDLNEYGKGKAKKIFD